MIYVLIYNLSQRFVLRVILSHLFLFPSGKYTKNNGTSPIFKGSIGFVCLQEGEGHDHVIALSFTTSYVSTKKTRGTCGQGVTLAVVQHSI